LAFEPINPRNAILEAVVIIRLSRPLGSDEAEAVKLAHKRIAEDLPKLETPPTVNLFLGPVPPGGPPPPLAAPVIMASYKRDGSLEARLAVDQNVLVVNFLQYGRWHDLWPKAALWLGTVVDALIAHAAVQEVPIGRPVVPLLVTGFAHQIIDVFNWAGPPTDVSAGELFVAEAPRVPREVYVRNQAWQVGHSVRRPSGWRRFPSAFEVDALTCDLAEDPNRGWRLRIDQTLEIQLATPHSLEGLFSGEAPEAEGAMRYLHDLNKSTIKMLLNQEMAQRIGLN
jgi:hypothetical protein